MKYILAIAIIAALTFGIQMFHDPFEWVRVWATIGLAISLLACVIAVANMDITGNLKE